MGEALCKIWRIHRAQNVIREINARHIVIDRENVAAIFVINEVIFKTAIIWRAATLFITARAELNIIAIDEGVIFNQRIDDRVIAVDRPIRDAVHHNQSSAKTCALEAFHVIIANRLPRINDANTACVIDVISKKDIAFNQGVIPVAHSKRTARFKEGVV